MTVPHWPWISGTLELLVPCVLIGAVHRSIARRGTFLLVVSNLPVSLFHECAHYLVALVLGGRPGMISLWPRKAGHGWVLGSVTFVPTVLSAFPAALAPLAWLPLGLLLFQYRMEFSGESLEGMFFLYAAVYVCFAASLPSLQDLRVALTHPLSATLWIGLAWGVWQFVGGG